VYKTRTIENHRKITEEICKKLISSIFLNLLLININKKLFCQVYIYYAKYFIKTIENKDYFWNCRSSLFLTSKKHGKINPKSRFRQKMELIDFYVDLFDHV